MTILSVWYRLSLVKTVHKNLNLFKCPKVPIHPVGHVVKVLKCYLLEHQPFSIIFIKKKTF